MKELTWNIKPIDHAVTKVLKERLKVSDALAKILAARGYCAPEDSEKFLYPKLGNLFDPFLFEDMNKIVSRIERALNYGENILVWGDEDADGIASTVLLFQVLKDLGANVSYYIPRRMREGIGLNRERLDRALIDGTKLIVTVDCGSENVVLVDYAKTKGMDIIITDHHELPKKYPLAHAFCNPKREGESYPYRELAGVGVAYKVAQAIATRRLKINYEQWFSVQRGLFVLLLVGTIGDRVPLTQENRIFVKFGLDQLNNTKSVWIEAIRRIRGNFNNIGSIMRNVIPILSAGRILSPENPVINLLLSEDLTECEQIVGALIEAESLWQDEVKEAYKKCSLLARDEISNKIIVVMDRSIPEFVLGACAYRLSKNFALPSFVIGCRDDGTLIGEGRALSNTFNIMGLLRDMEDLFISYGGHKPAAGFVLKPDKFDEFKDRAISYVEKKFLPSYTTIEIDTIVSVDELTHQFVEEVKKLAPFGEANPKPILITKGVSVDDVKNNVVLRNLNLPKFESKIDIVYSVGGYGDYELKAWEETTNAQ